MLGSLDTTGFRKGLTFLPVVFRRARITASTSSAVSAVRTHTTLGSPKAVRKIERKGRKGGRKLDEVVMMAVEASDTVSQE